MINITDYKAGENVLCTAEIQAAFDAAAAQRETVMIPPGTFSTGTINMKGASLYLAKGAVLKGSPNIEDYPFYGYVHNEMGEVRSLLYTMENEGITISGEGTIDLNGSSFYDFDKRALPPSKVPFTPKQIAECTAVIEKRPVQPIFFYRSSRITLTGIKIINAPCWTLAFIECQNIRITDLTIDNDLRIPNNDGMHFSSCTDVFVRGCCISAGDDCIAMTAITDWGKPCERVVISDCIMRSCSKAISIGYMHSIIRDVTITNCLIRESNRGLVIMSSAGTGLVENVTVSNLRLDTRIRAGNWWGNGEPICLMGTYHNMDRYRDAVPDRHYPAAIRNVSFQNIICSGENAIAVIGENNSVQNVSFDHVFFELKDSDNLSLKGRIIDLAPGEQTAALPENGVPYWLYVKQAGNVRAGNVILEPYKGQPLKALFEGCEDTYTP